jgi:hypothetical protein
MHQEFFHPAILIAALSSFLLGGLWYSPVLFGNAWNRENGGVPAPGHPARVFGISFLFSVVAAYAFAWWLGPTPTLHEGLHAGLLAGGGLVATSFGINYQFAQRSLRLWLIDGGYHLAQFLLFGLIIGSWH